MSSISAKMLSKLNTADFHVGTLSADSTDRATLVKVKPEDIDILIDNLLQLKTYVADLQVHKQANARKLLESIVAESSDFSSVEELLSALSGAPPVVSSTNVNSKPTMSKTSTNKSYEIVLFDQAADVRRKYTISNKVLPKALEKDSIYQELVKKNRELKDIDLFLRAYSPDYAKQYPFNAKFKKHEFHLNSKGRLNTQSTKYYEEWKKDYPNGDEKDFKEQTTKAYKTV